MTIGIAALGAKAIARIVKTIEVYDDFCHANDPYEEHDFGSFEIEGHTVFFKIDYHDPTLTMHSLDPSDPSITKRVITIMLAEEYCEPLVIDRHCSEFTEIRMQMAKSYLRVNPACPTRKTKR
jgi:hypothetical protein